MYLSNISRTEALCYIQPFLSAISNAVKLVLGINDFSDDDVVKLHISCQPRGSQGRGIQYSSMKQGSATYKNHVGDASMLVSAGVRLRSDGSNRVGVASID